MLSTVSINKSLKELESLYNTSRGNLKPQFFAKLAIIEASTWIEQSIDEIFKELLNSKLTFSADRNEYLKTINDTYGFNYEKYIRKRLMKDLVGYFIIEKIENRLLVSAAFHQMKASLNALAMARNSCAHEHISGTTPTIHAPSVTIGYLNDIYLGLKLLRIELKRIK